MAKHKNVFDERHIECPDRILRTFAKIVEEGLDAKCQMLKSRQATMEELLVLHSADYIDEMSSYQDKTLEELRARGEQFNSIYLSKEVHECACLSAGCTLELLDHVMNGKADNGMAIVRPPGHHAISDEPMGFCYYNNVALAAKIAKTKYGVERVLIVDWDIHFGNGTESVFRDDSSVLYFSIHRFDIWPFLASGDANQIGEGAGQGFTVNVPWTKGGMGDGDYLAAFNMLLMPIAYEFNPDLVLVSCGFDSGLGDPRGHCLVTPEGYAQMTNLLLGLADGKVLLILEGGYNLSTVSHSTVACVKSLLRMPIPRMTSVCPCESGLRAILKAMHHLQPYWKCLQWIDVLKNNLTVLVEKKSADVCENSVNASEEKTETKTVTQPADAEEQNGS